MKECYEKYLFPKFKKKMTGYVFFDAFFVFKFPVLNLCTILRTLLAYQCCTAIATPPCYFYTPTIKDSESSLQEYTKQRDVRRTNQISSRLKTKDISYQEFNTCIASQPLILLHYYYTIVQYWQQHRGEDASTYQQLNTKTIHYNIMSQC